MRPKKQQFWLDNDPAPCMGCSDRQPGCHSKCERYDQFRTNRENKLKQKSREALLR